MSKSKHVIIWENAHGPVPAGGQIHHINGNHRDNRIRNLKLVTPAEHSKLHSKNYRFKDGIIVERRCCTCRKWMGIDKFYKQGPGYYPNCKKCHNEMTRAWQDRNKERSRNNLRAWRSANRDKVAEQNARYTERYKKWAAANAEHLREYQREYRRKHLG